MDFILPLLQGAIPAAAAPYVWPAILASLFLAGVVAGMFFMIAYFFQSPQLTAVAHEELAAFFFSIFIVLFWVASAGFFN